MQSLNDQYLKKYGFRIENMDGKRYVWNGPEGYAAVTLAGDDACIPATTEDPITFWSYDKDGRVLLEQRYETSTDLFWQLLAMKMVRDG